MSKQSKLAKEFEALPKSEQVKFMADVNKTVKDALTSISTSISEAITPTIEMINEAERLYALTQIENISAPDLFEAIRKAKPSPQVISFLMVEAEDGAKKKIGERTSQQNSKNASNPRKKLPSKERLESLKKEFQENYFTEHGVKIKRGWKKFAREKLLNEYGSIDNKTINRIIKGE